MRLIAMIVLAAILLVSCGEERSAATAASAEDPGAEASWPVRAETEGGNYAVTVKPVKGEIVLAKHFSLDVTVVPKDPDAGSLAVKVDADMPAHRHGMNTQPELVEKGAGHYQVDGMFFHMKGEWVIMVDVTRDGKTERASVPVQID